MNKKYSIEQLARKKQLRVCGLMSGTSVDGIDAAIVDISDSSADVVTFDTYPFPVQVREAIFDIFQNQAARIEDICHLNFVIGEVFADSVIKLCKNKNVPIDSIDLIGSHGQTVFHNPKGRKFGKRLIRSTLQIGEPSVIAQRTGITTVADFRPGDMAAGGQGAPLVPFADYFLFRDKVHCRTIQNIGGIANVTYLPANCTLQNVIAFDTGPGNMIIDHLISRITKGKQKYDKSGKMAAQGGVNKKLLGQLLEHPFFRRKPPKTTGREEFGSQFSDMFFQKALEQKIPNEDILATATALTAETIARAYRRFLPAMPDEMLLCGGGYRNKTLVKMLQEKLRDVKILTTGDFGINPDAKEAVSFAVLAYAAIKSRPNNVPGATGAEKGLILGKIVPV
ncbi:MAG: anhydro-N-acetylmuramic acid kinase [Sedimentisphaerales bacterium]|nr:anhydro-N-acetylmuramic acid kinase [Sedimentisphaerales bacterium]